jgi:hypothetical protein
MQSGLHRLEDLIVPGIIVPGRVSGGDEVKAGELGGFVEGGWGDAIMNYQGVVVEFLDAIADEVMDGKPGYTLHGR